MPHSNKELMIFSWRCALCDSGALIVLAHDADEARELARVSATYRYAPEALEGILGGEPRVSQGPHVVSA